MPILVLITQPFGDHCYVGVIRMVFPFGIASHLGKSQEGLGCLISLVGQFHVHTIANTTVGARRFVFHERQNYPCCIGDADKIHIFNLSCFTRF